MKTRWNLLNLVSHKPKNYTATTPTGKTLTFVGRGCCKPMLRMTKLLNLLEVNI